VLENVSTKDVQVVSKTISGDIFEGVSQLSKSLKIDLIVLSPQSVEIKDEVYLGKGYHKNNTPNRYSAFNCAAKLSFQENRYHTICI